MNKLSIGVVLALGVAGCSKKKPQENKEPPAPIETGSADTGSAGSAAAAEKPLAGKDLADRYIKCVGLISDGKIDDFKSTCISTSYKGHAIDEGDITLDQLTGQFAALHRGFSDFKMAPQLVLVNNRDILAVGLSTGTNNGPLAMPGMPEIPATNKKVSSTFFHRLAIDDQNKASEEWMYENPITFMGQLGLLPKGAPPVRMEQAPWPGAPIVQVADGSDKEKKNLDVVKKMVDDFNAKKNTDMLAGMTDDVVESDEGDAKDNTGKKAVENGLKTFQTAFPDGKITTENIWAAGDYVVLTAAFEGTNTGDMGPMKKTGKKVSSHVAEIYQLKDGKVSHVWRFMNGLAMMQQLGLAPAAGDGAGSGAGSAAGSAAPKK